MTRKQREIVLHIAGATEPPSLNELVHRLGGAASKQAMRCSLAWLARGGFLAMDYEIRDSRKSLVVHLTNKGREVVKTLTS
jgi:hypothetical protein